MIEAMTAKGDPPLLSLLSPVRGERSVLLPLNAPFAIPLGLSVAHKGESGYKLFPVVRSHA
jgi:hypothetical protein